MKDTDYMIVAERLFHEECVLPNGHYMKGSLTNGSFMQF